MTTLKDRVLTIVLWCYFTLGYGLFFAPWHLICHLFAADPTGSFQAVNHYFYRLFFLLLGTLKTDLKLRVAPEVARIRSSVIISNHLSYLDPLLMIAIYKRHCTIVKSRLFKIPIFGRMLRLSGYLPSAPPGNGVDLFLRRMEELPRFFAAGGNLFIFPEGTRSRSGQISRLNKGAFKIARLCKVPIQVVRIQNTEKLFRPGKFWFNTQRPVSLTVELVTTFDSGTLANNSSLSRMAHHAGALLTDSSRDP